MKMNQLFEIFFLILYLIHNRHVNGEMASDYPWMYYRPYGDNVTLSPLFQNESIAKSIQITSCEWITPNHDYILAHFPEYDTNRFKLDTQNCTLTIVNIQSDTNGVYHCKINNIYISKAMLNINGPPAKSLTQKYKYNIIAGFSTFFAILIIFSSTCLVIKFRWQDPQVLKGKYCHLIDFKRLNID
jgi:hypothetical protein